MSTVDESTRIIERLDRAAAAARFHLPRVVVHHVRRGRWQIGWYQVHQSIEGVEGEGEGAMWQVRELVRSSAAWGEPVVSGPALFASTDPESAVIDAACRALEEVMAAALLEETGT